MYTPLLPLPCLAQYHVYFILCSILFLRCFVFCLSSFLIHVVPYMHPILVHIFISFLYSSWIICVFVTKRERVLSFLYDSCPHSQGEKFYFLCTFVGGEILRGYAYAKGEKIPYNEKTLFCFVSFYIIFVFVRF